METSGDLNHNNDSLYMYAKITKLHMQLVVLLLTLYAYKLQIKFVIRKPNGMMNTDSMNKKFVDTYVASKLLVNI